MKLQSRHLSVLLLGIGASAASAHEITWREPPPDVDPGSVEAGEAPRSGEPAGRGRSYTTRLRLTVRDAKTGEIRPAIVSFLDGRGRQRGIKGLIERGVRTIDERRDKGWFVVPRAMGITVPRSIVGIEATSGLDTELSWLPVSLTEDTVDVTILLAPIEGHDSKRWRSANTHLHLRDMTLDELTRYLYDVPAVDGLDLTFVSYLSRHGKDDRTTSNMLTPQNLESLSDPRRRLAWGIEHRHNFGAFKEGYGHVMFLDVAELLEPVSLGPSLSTDTNDDVPLHAGIQAARELDGTVIWCHGLHGLEDIASWMHGALDAQNIFDGLNKGKYEDAFYLYYDIGLEIPMSTGTDWFIHDFSRTYADVGRKLTVDRWLEALRKGRSYITNGPLLTFEVDDAGMGEVISLKSARPVRVRCTATGRSNFGAIEIVHNGEPIHTVEARRVGGHFEARFDGPIDVREPSWIAARVAGYAGRNVLGAKIFAHTTPVHVEIDHQRRFVAAAAQDLLERNDHAAERVMDRGEFSSPEAAQAMLELYVSASDTLAARMQRNGHGPPYRRPRPSVDPE